MRCGRHSDSHCLNEAVAVVAGNASLGKPQVQVRAHPVLWARAHAPPLFADRGHHKLQLWRRFGTSQLGSREWQEVGGLPR